MVAKAVPFYLFYYLDGDTADHDDEVEEARWIDLGAALIELSLRGRAQDGGARAGPLGQRPVACRS